MWDKLKKKWVRTGKAIHVGPRKIQHDNDCQTKDELFYRTYRDRWTDISFHVSVTFDDAMVDEAARFMVFGKETTKHLNATTTKWGKPKAALALHHKDMMKRHLLFYLLEKVDELLADRMDVSTASESIGFEGPLWSALPRNQSRKIINELYQE